MDSIVIYGAGFRGGREFLRISEENIHVVAYIDRDAEEKRIYYGTPVFTCKEFIEHTDFRHYPVVIAIDNKEIQDKICKELRKKKVKVYHNFEEYVFGTYDIDTETLDCGGDEKGYGRYKIAPNFFPDNHRIGFSFGIGNNCTFEEHLINEYNFELFCFDPTQNSKEYIRKTGMGDKYPDRFHFYNFGISDIDGKKDFRRSLDHENMSEMITPWTASDTEKLDVYRLETLMKMFLGTEKHLDILKMDIEGSEFVAMPDILNSSLDITQICLELHSRMYNEPTERTRCFKKMMNSAGYKLVSCSTPRDHLYVKTDY